MNDLKSIAALVRTLLEQDNQCRNSDGVLYLRVLFAHAEKNGIDLNTMTIPDFLLHHHGADFPIFESVRRARQKVQQLRPDLSGCKAVEECRAEKESEFRDFARGECL